MQEYIQRSSAIGPSTSGDLHSSNLSSGHMPYTSEVDGKTMRFPCFAHFFTMSALAS